MQPQLSVTRAVSFLSRWPYLQFPCLTEPLELGLQGTRRQQPDAKPNCEGVVSLVVFLKVAAAQSLVPSIVLKGESARHSHLGLAHTCVCRVGKGKGFLGTQLGSQLLVFFFFLQKQEIFTDCSWVTFVPNKWCLGVLVWKENIG